MGDIRSRRPRHGDQSLGLEGGGSIIIVVKDDAATSGPTTTLPLCGRLQTRSDAEPLRGPLEPGVRGFLQW